MFVPHPQTSKLIGHQLRATMPELAKIYLAPPAWACWLAVGASVEQGVRPHWRATALLRYFRHLHGDSF